MGTWQIKYKMIVENRQTNFGDDILLQAAERLSTLEMISTAIF